MAEGAPLLREYTLIAYRGFESLSLRQFQNNIINWLNTLYWLDCRRENRSRCQPTVIRCPVGLGKIRAIRKTDVSKKI